MLRACKGYWFERVKVEFTEAMKAITIRAEPNKDFFHIVMPMQME
jgi:DNA polymerase-3 subunit beta